MKSRILKSIAALALIAPMATYAENYLFEFKANPGADGNAAPYVGNDINFKLFVNTTLTPSISIENLNKSEYWKNNGFILELSHNGKTVRLNDALISSSGPLDLGPTGFVEIYSNVDDFFDVDFHPDDPLVELNSLPYDAFVYGQIDVYNNQKPFQDLLAIATTGNTSLLSAYAISAVPEPGTMGLTVTGILAYMAIGRRSRRKTN